MSTQNRLGKIAAWFLIGLIAVIAGIIIFALTYDWNRARPWINAQVSEKIGRPFAIEGPLSLSWSRSSTAQGWQAYVPWPRFTAETITVGNPAWAKKPHLARLDKASFEVALLPLLHREIFIPTITLLNPTIDLEIAQDNQVNWNLGIADSSSPSTWTVNLDELTFSAGQLFFSDQQKKLDIHTIVAPIGQSINLDAIQNKLASSPATAGTPARTAPASTSTTPSPSAPPSASTTLADPAVSSLQSSSPSSAAPSSPAPANAKTPYAFAFTMTGHFKEAPVKGSGKLGGVLSLMDAKRPFPLQADMQIGDNHIGLDGTISNPANLAALDMQLSLASTSMAKLYELTGVTLPETPPFKTQGHLTARLDRKNRSFTYRDFSGLVGTSDLSGTLEYVMRAPRPQLSGSVKSKKLVFADLAPLIGADSNAEKKIRGAKPQKTDKAVPEEQFRTERWKAMDADVTFTGEQIIRDASLPISNMHTHLVMKEGVLTLKPLKFGVAGGTLAGDIFLNGSTVPLKGSFDISARRLRLKQLFPKFDLMRTSIGEVNGDAALSAQGNSPASWAATSNGDVKIVMNEGAISSTLLEQAGLNVANIVIAKLFGDKTVQINCAAGHFVVKQGVLDTRVFALDTSDAIINVTGTVHLANERLNLDVTPHTKSFRIISLRSPLYVKGTFKDPNVGVAPGPLLVRGGGAIALGLINPFASLLALVVPPTEPETSPCVGLLKKTPASSKKSKQAESAKASGKNTDKAKKTLPKNEGGDN